MCGLRQHASWRAASRYALGVDGVGAARLAPAASLISASRYALGARRTALRACVPSGTAAGSAIAASRYALGAEGVGAARPGACDSLFAASRYALSAPKAWALRARAPTCCPPPR